MTYRYYSFDMSSWMVDFHGRHLGWTQRNWVSLKQSDTHKWWTTYDTSITQYAMNLQYFAIIHTVYTTLIYTITPWQITAYIIQIVVLQYIYIYTYMCSTQQIMTSVLLFLGNFHRFEVYYAKSRKQKLRIVCTEQASCSTCLCLSTAPAEDWEEAIDKAHGLAADRLPQRLCSAAKMDSQATPCKLSSKWQEIRNPSENRNEQPKPHQWQTLDVRLNSLKVGIFRSVVGHIALLIWTACYNWLPANSYQRQDVMTTSLKETLVDNVSTDSYLGP